MVKYSSEIDGEQQKFALVILLYSQTNFVLNLKLQTTHLHSQINRLKMKISYYLLRFIEDVILKVPQSYPSTKLCYQFSPCQDNLYEEIRRSSFAKNTLHYKINIQ